eukprot:scaffold831_cov268-Pinguiococcus_pyrenoidosus.AAC.2
MAAFPAASSPAAPSEERPARHSPAEAAMHPPLAVPRASSAPPGQACQACQAVPAALAAPPDPRAASVPSALPGPVERLQEEESRRSMVASEVPQPGIRRACPSEAAACPASPSPEREKEWPRTPPSLSERQ